MEGSSQNLCSGVVVHTDTCDMCLGEQVLDADAAAAATAAVGE